MKDILDILYENGYEAYIVGGYVRDYLLGRDSKDIDISTNAPISQLKKIFKGKGKSYDMYFAYHIDSANYSYDITSYRKELEYKKNKPIKLEMASDLKTDLLRRDFTINTFAMDKDLNFVDLLDAKTDLDNKIIRVVGDTSKKFNEDKTRILRAIRFSVTLDFKLDNNILDFINKKKTYLLNEVTPQYKKSELDKIFDSNNVLSFFELLDKYNIGSHFNIEYNKVRKSYNKYGIWAQVKTDLPFSRKEKNIIDSIKKILDNRDITFSDISIYDNEVLYNASTILGLNSKLKAYKDIINMHSIIEIEIDPDTILKYVKYNDVKKVYKMIEKNIIEGNIYNSKESIEMYLRNIRL